MSRILFAWELGANYGHLTRLAPIAEKLRAAGHQVFFAVRDLKGAAEVLGAKGFAFAQAPVPTRRPRSQTAPANYAEMIALEGYADPTLLWGMARGWISLAQLFRAEIIVADHSPGALLAGRILGLPCACIGNSFDIPPRVAPLPSIRPWENIAEDRLRRSEQAVTQVINGVIGSFRGRKLERLADLFDVEARIFATFPELDAYGRRTGERYIGPIYDANFGERAGWPEGDPPRIFAYLRPSVPGVGNILQALKAAKATTVCVMPGIRPEAARKLASARLLITPRPLQLAAILPQADLALLYASHGVLCAALAAGVPSLVAPQNVEQYLHGKRLEALGAGVVIDNDRSVASIAAHIEKALADGGLKKAARAFSALHAGFDPAQVVEEAAKIIGSLGSETAPKPDRPLRPRKAQKAAKAKARKPGK